ncbi:MAG TPA: tRNA (adenosine(37)-N6)-threonylcarbamoyltransferase complex dimerization subunit type 1 TsaB [Gaiellaceae bacterium]|nr:tRNA (adenosine(37)-N6)-threonylcarbamoyltransferase complex dimerization subunit type 1 TsaB [Gaiellaceae bacterium]
MGLVLAFDTATHVATVALVENGRAVGERTTRAFRVLADAAELLAGLDAAPADVESVVVGTGPGSFTGTRLGLALARGFALARGVPVAGVSTLDALAAGAPGALPVIDAGRREVFAFVGGEARALPADALEVDGVTCVGDGALRYRAALEGRGGTVPPDSSPEHVPHARLHAAIARDFGEASAVMPLYVREPDAKAAR